MSNQMSQLFPVVFLFKCKCTVACAMRTRLLRLAQLTWHIKQVMREVFTFFEKTHTHTHARMPTTRQR